MRLHEFQLNHLFRSLFRSNYITGSTLRVHEQRTEAQSAVGRNNGIDAWNSDGSRFRSDDVRRHDSHVGVSDGWKLLEQSEQNYSATHVSSCTINTDNVYELMHTFSYDFN